MGVATKNGLNNNDNNIILVVNKVQNLANRSCISRSMI